MKLRATHIMHVTDATNKQTNKGYNKKTVEIAGICSNKELSKNRERCQDPKHSLEIQGDSF